MKEVKDSILANYEINLGCILGARSKYTAQVLSDAFARVKKNQEG